MATWMHRAASKGPTRSQKMDFIFCSRKHGGCGYQWTWRSKCNCHSCGRLLVPSPAVQKEAGGAWGKEGGAKKSEAQRIAELQAIVAKDFGEQGLGGKLGQLLSEARTELKEAKPAWYKSQEDQRELDRKKRALDNPDKQILLAETAVAEAKKKLEELQGRQAELRVEVVALEKKIEKTRTVIKGEPLELQAILPGLEELSAEGAPNPHIEQAVAAVQQGVEQIRKFIAEAAEAKKLQADTAKQAEESTLDPAKAAAAAKQEEREMGTAGGSEQARRQGQEPAGQEDSMVVDSAELDAFCKDLDPDFDDKPAEHKEAVKKRAADMFVTQAKKLRPGPYSG